MERLGNKLPSSSKKSATTPTTLLQPVTTIQLVSYSPIQNEDEDLYPLSDDETVAPSFNFD